MAIPVNNGGRPMHAVDQFIAEHAQTQTNKKTTTAALFLIACVALMVGAGLFGGAGHCVNAMACMGSGIGCIVVGLISLVWAAVRRVVAERSSITAENVVRTAQNVALFNHSVLPAASFLTVNDPAKARFFLEHLQDDYFLGQEEEERRLAIYSSFVELLHHATREQNDISYEMARILARFPTMMGWLCQDGENNRSVTLGEDLLPTARKVFQARDLLYFYMNDPQREIFMPDRMESLVDAPEEQLADFVTTYIGIMKQNGIRTFEECGEFMASLPLSVFEAFAIHILPPNQERTTLELKELIQRDLRLIYALYSRHADFSRLIREGKILIPALDQADPFVADFLLTDFPKYVPTLPPLENDIKDSLRAPIGRKLATLGDVQRLNEDEKRFFNRYTPLEQSIDRVQTREEARAILELLSTREQIDARYITAFKTLLQKATEEEEVWSDEICRLVAPLHREICVLYREATRATGNGFELNLEADPLSKKVVEHAPRIFSHFMMSAQNRAAFLRREGWNRLAGLDWNQRQVELDLESLARASDQYLINFRVHEWSPEAFAIAQRLIANHGAQGPFEPGMQRIATAIEARRAGTLAV